jgi:hypothetical protein
MNADRRKKLQEAVGTLATAKLYIEECRDEEQEAFNNLPDGFKEGEQGQKLEENIGELDDAMNEIDAVSEKLEELSA